jgi:uncharacterized protein (TIGR03083 family)
MSAVRETSQSVARPAIVVPQAEANAVLRAAADQVAALLRCVPDASTPIPHLAWSVAETSIHLVAGTRVYLGCAQGQCSPVRELDALPELNARLFRDFPTREATSLAGLLDEAVEAFLDATAQARGDEEVSWHAGYVLPLSMMTGVLIGELLVHGYDIALATGQPWTIRAGHARYAIAGLVSVLPMAVDATATRGVVLGYELRVRGGPRWVLRFRDGALKVERSAGQPVDFRLTVEPTPYLLVSYGRRGQSAAILRGHIRAWGRKPWLALGVKRYFRRV